MIGLSGFSWRICCGKWDLLKGGISMMDCVKLVRYQVRFNSEETYMFVPSRRLRQGDPLSPYLFLLCMEGLSSLLLYEEEVGSIDGVRACRKASSVLHLFIC
jgi:hypothetical protein